MFDASWRLPSSPEWNPLVGPSEPNVPLEDSSPETDEPSGVC